MRSTGVSIAAADRGDDAAPGEGTPLASRRRSPCVARRVAARRGDRRQDDRVRGVSDEAGSEVRCRLSPYMRSHRDAVELGRQRLGKPIRGAARQRELGRRPRIVNRRCRRGARDRFPLPLGGRAATGRCGGHGYRASGCPARRHGLRGLPSPPLPWRSGRVQAVSARKRWSTAKASATPSRSITTRLTASVSDKSRVSFASKTSRRAAATSRSSAW